VKQGVVGVGAALFDHDLGMERGMLGCESLDVSFVHRSISFRWLSRDSSVNRTRKRRFVSLLRALLGGRQARLVALPIGNDGHGFVG
jgi:hypothetical protein